MDMQHLTPFLAAMDAGQVDALAEHLSDDVVLLSPLLPDPFHGKEAVMKVLNVLHSAIDSFETEAVLQGEDRVAAIVRVRAGDIVCTGMDDMRVDADGKVKSMSVQWRPLQNIVAMQNRFAPLIGVPALELVERQG